MNDILLPMRVTVLTALLAVASAAIASGATAARAQSAGAPSLNGARAVSAAVGAQVESMAPSDYVIGPDDILEIVFWREKDLSTQAVVRPDGRISIPLLNDVDVTGLTPIALREKLMAQAQQYVQDPNVTVLVRQINSRRVFITGKVNKPGPYMLTAPVNVLQLIAMAGGLLEYADAKNVLVMRTENGRPASYRFNYREVIDRKNLKQNINLKPGDTVIVP